MPGRSPSPLLLALTALAWWRIQQRGPGEALEAFTREPKAVMGTTARLIAVRTPGESELAEQALNAAEAELRRIEALMSTWIESSELSRLNAAPAGQAIELSTATLEVIAAAKAAHVETGGAFDATCRPLIELWRQAGKSGVLPSEAELRAARAASTWGDFEIGESAVAKKKASARLDLGGIAKGYAIDRALAVLKAHRCLGGLVEVGGDLACFGDSGSEAGWSVAVRDPFVGGEGKRSAQDGSAAARESGAAASAGELEALWLRPGQAVCTSGDYERYSEIAGERYSHIIGPADRAAGPGERAGERGGRERDGGGCLGNGSVGAGVRDLARARGGDPGAGDSPQERGARAQALAGGRRPAPVVVGLAPGVEKRQSAPGVETALLHDEDSLRRGVATK
jgi:thiamine biosynthesis lipoprotein